MDKNTFGKTKQEILLATMLTEKDNKKVTSFVTRFFNSVNKHIKVLILIEEVTTSHLVYNLYRDHLYKIIDTSDKLNGHDKIKNKIRDVLKIKLSAILKEPISKARKINENINIIFDDTI